MEFDRHTLVVLVRPADAPDLPDEVVTWMTPAGNVRFEQVARPRSMAEAHGDG